MPSSNLQNLVRDLLAPINNNPTILLQKVLNEKQMRWYRTMMEIKNNVAVQTILKMKGIPADKVDPEAIIRNLLQVIDTKPTESWLQMEEAIKGVIAGDPDAVNLAKDIFGVMTHASPNQT